MSTNAERGTFEYTAGLDVGNGYTKGVIEDRHRDAPGAVTTDIVDLPSVEALIAHPREVRADDAQVVTEAANVDEWYNSIDVSFSSPLVGDSHRRLLGRKGLSARKTPTTFDVLGAQSKAEQSLSSTLVLGVLAAKAVRDYVLATGALPGVADSSVQALTVDAVLALALPIGEYATHRQSYAAGFTGTADAPAVHQVRLEVYNTVVTVKITFSSVIVVPEGASAQYAINRYGEPLMNKMLDDVRAKGQVLENISAADLLAATDTIGVDVGEGTVNFPVFTAGRFNDDASYSYDEGYGHVLEAAMETMNEQRVRHGFTERKSLAEFLQTPAKPTKRAFHARVAEVVDTQSRYFSDQVAAELVKVLNIVGARTEVIYVYGGGSGPLREHLHAAITERVVEIVGADAAPVLYLDATYSRGLNREGLIIAARNRAGNL